MVIYLYMYSLFSTKLGREIDINLDKACGLYVFKHDQSFENRSKSEHYNKHLKLALF